MSLTLSLNNQTLDPRIFSCEWLETNALGGYASSSVSAANTRRYHGLLVAAANPAQQRQVIISKLDENIRCADINYELGVNCYPGTIHPQGYKYLASFSREIFPVFEYNLGRIIIRKTIACIHGENTSVIFYEVLKADQTFSLELRPFFACRDYHALTKANKAINTSAVWQKPVLKYRAYETSPEVHMKADRAEYEHRPEWYYNFEYEQERLRGFEYKEDLFTPGIFSVQLKQGENFGVVISLSAYLEKDAALLLKLETNRRKELLATHNQNNADELLKSLTLASDQFLIKKSNNRNSIIAGYHWFTDWGRDTMISLPGICLVNKRFEEAKGIFREFIGNLSQGMIPNRFSDTGAVAEYNTIDATLWLFVALHKYLKYSADQKFIKEEMLGPLDEIIEWHRKGTRYGISVDNDFLLQGGQADNQLTWMDAKVGVWVVTPRTGKAVEINALWYNALSIMHEFHKIFGNTGNTKLYKELAEKVKKSFNKVFWNSSLDCLYDCINNDLKDAKIRPNQIFALSLPYTLLSKDKALRVLKVIDRKLYTPFGLRTLAADDLEYRGQYLGDSVSRDFAYHQGTVWAWLLGPYLTAVSRYMGAKARSRVRQVTNSIQQHLSQACIGSISEIFDGDAPHQARGCIAQAWSVAEILRAYVEDCEPLVSNKSANLNSTIFQDSVQGDLR